MWKRKQFNKGQTHFENRLGKGKAGGGEGGGGLGAEGGGGSGGVFSGGGDMCSLALQLVSAAAAAAVKDRCPPQGRLSSLRGFQSRKCRFRF